MYPPWSKFSEKELAKYVTVRAEPLLGKLDENTFDLEDTPDGRRRKLELIYTKLLQAGIYYDLEPFRYDDKLQEIRTPADIFSGAGRGTCLDLSVLFAGLAEAYNLLPVLVIMQSHAFVVVSISDDLANWNGLKRAGKAKLGDLVKEIQDLRDLVDSGNYLAIECTGFASSAKLRDNPTDGHPETMGRNSDGVMTFDDALAAGKAQLFERDDKLGFALDIGIAHRTLEPYEIGSATAMVSERRPVEAEAVETKHGKATVAVSGEVMVTVDLESDDGAVVVRVKDDEVPTPVEHPAPVKPFLKPLKGFIGRNAELDAARLALGNGETFGAYGGPGWGKTALLRSIAFDDTGDFPDGVVYQKVPAAPSSRPAPDPEVAETPEDVNVEDTIYADLLQNLYKAFYTTDPPLKQSPETIRLALQEKQALVILDDVHLDADTVENIVNTLPMSTFVVSAESAAPFPKGRPLRGLAADDALTFFEKQLGRPIAEDERDAAREICKALDGHPGHLIEARNAVLGGKSLAEVARTYQGTAEPSEVVAESVRADLTPIQQKVAEILDAALVPVSLTLLERILKDDLEGLPTSLHEEIRALIDQERVEQHSPRYSLTGTVAEGALKHWSPSDWMGALLSNLADWSESPEVTNDDINRDREFILRALEWGVEAEQWTEVIRVARATDRGIALGLHWAAWKQVLEHALAAAEGLGETGLSAKAWALHQLGARAIGLGDDAAGLAYLTEALDLRTELGETRAANVTKQNLKLVKAVPAKVPAGAAVVAGLVGALLLFVTAWASVGGWTKQLTFEPSGLTFISSGEIGESVPRVISLVNETEDDIGPIAIGVDSPEFTVDGGRGDVDRDSDSVSLGGDAPLAADAIDPVGPCLLDPDGTIAVLERESSCELRVVYTRASTTNARAALSASVTDPEGTITADLQVVMADEPPTPDTTSPTGNGGTGTTPGDVDGGNGDTTTTTSGTTSTSQNGVGPVLSVEISPPSREAVIGTTVEYEVNVSSGDSPVSGVTVRVSEAPPELSIELVDQGGRTCDSTCELRELAGAQTLIARVQVLPDAAGGNTLQFEITVAEDSVDQSAATAQVEIPARRGEAAAEPDAIAFPTVAVGTSLERVVTLTNIGNGPLTIEPPAISGSEAFTADSDCEGAPLASGDSCLITVVFTPSAVGPAPPTELVITHDGTPGETKVALTGSGQAGPTPPPTVPPPAGPAFVEIESELLAFDSTTSTHQVDVVNVGGTPVTITGIAGLTNFQATGCVGTSLGPNESCVLTVTFDLTGDRCEVLELLYAGEGDRRILLKGSS